MVKRIALIVAQNPVLLDDAAGMLRAGRLEAVQVPVLLIEGAEKARRSSRRCMTPWLRGCRG